MAEVTAIVLAAGESRRMGTQKALLPFGKSTILQTIVSTLQGSRVAEIVVITGHAPEGIEALLRDNGAGTPMPRTVHNADYEEGMLSSVRCGLRAIRRSTGAALVALGDQPAISAEVVDALIATWEAGEGGICVPLYAAQRGHPLLLDLRFRETVLHAFDGEGLRGLLRRYPEDVRELPVADAGVLQDLDRPEDYRAAVRIC